MEPKDESVEPDSDESKMFERGQRAAFRSILSTALRELYPADDLTVERLVLEREDVVRALREVCAGYGDNDWEPTLHLGDVIEKHLLRHLEARDDSPDSEPATSK